MVRGKNEKNKEKWTNRIRSYSATKTSFSNNNRKTRQKEIEKVEKKALSSKEILKLLRNSRNFLGVFSSDELSSIRIMRTPTFLISNLDIKSGPGTHWICIRIGKSSVELFDSLGFDRKLWGSFPIGLQTFLKRYQFSHSFITSPVLQPYFTSDCGLYCIYFVIYRQNLSFNRCVLPFSRLLTKNHFRLIKLLKSV